MYDHDWRKAIHRAPSYSIPGSSSSLQRKQINFVSFVIITGTFILLSLYAFVPESRTTLSAQLDDEHGHGHEKASDCKCLEYSNQLPNHKSYNSTYPITPIQRLPDGRLKFKIAAVADLDKKSRDKNSNKWFSFVMNGNLLFDPNSNTVEINWNKEELQITSDFAAGSRGMELSDLVTFNGKLFTCDDRTGIVYELKLDSSLLVPWIILANGRGDTSKGFKCEWMLVKDQHLEIGSLGKEWTTASGDVVINHDPQWIKKISPSGEVEHLDWRSNYLELRRAAGIHSPGYLIHEAAVWSDLSKKYYFLPRRASNHSYDELLDEQRGTNILLTADGNFTNINMSGVIGPLVKTHGFSSIKLLPLPKEVKIQPSGSEIAIALKSEEDGDVISTYVTAFRLPDGHVLYPETQISSKHKYEGIEFV